MDRVRHGWCVCAMRTATEVILICRAGKRVAGQCAPGWICPVGQVTRARETVSH